MKVAVFHPGTQHSWQTALALQQLGLLEWYATSLFYDPARWPYRLEHCVPMPLANWLHREFIRFRHDGLAPGLVRTHGLYEWGERIASRVGASGLARRLDRIGNRRFAASLAADICSDRRFALWGYNASSLEAFRLGRENGRLCILDQTIGDFRAYNQAMSEIAQRDAAWFLPATRSIDQTAIARADEEYEAADTIVVGCDYAARTVREHARDPAVAAKLQVLPYCHDDALFGNLPPPGPVPRDAPVRFLFLGQLVPRKGIQHVLEAFARIPRGAARLTLVGALGIPRETFARYAEMVEYVPTVPRREVPRLMQDHHVFLLPTYHEGGGIVLNEALAAGMALIQSRNATIAVTPKTGVLLDEISSDALHAAMMTAIEERAKLNSWRAAAQARARQFSFARYRDNIAALLDSLIF